MEVVGNPLPECPGLWVPACQRAGVPGKPADRGLGTEVRRAVAVTQRGMMTGFGSGTRVLTHLQVRRSQMCPRRTLDPKPPRRG